MTLADAGELIREKGFITVAEPASGAGGMIIAAADVITKQGFDIGHQLYVDATDISPMCFKMTYLQAALRGMPRLSFSSTSSLAARAKDFCASAINASASSKTPSSSVAPFLKGYTVFNAEQCDGLPAQYTAKAEPPALPQAARLERADAFFAATGADIRHGGTKAFYAHGPDYARYLDSLHRPSIELGGLVQVANRRDPRATRSALTSDGAARVGGACLPTWASLGMGVRGKGANGLWMTLRVLRRPLSRSRSAERRQVSTATFRSF